MDAGTETQRLLGPSTTQTKVYGRRWYMLTVLSAISFIQGCIWNNWGPIAPAVQPIFGWSSGTIALLANWGPIAYLIAVFPTSWLMDTRGLRTACLVAALLCFLGAGIRCFTIKPSYATPLIHVGQVLNGLAGPVAMAAAPVLSSTWFPPNQRTTATSIMTASNYFGVAVSFILGPIIVPDRREHSRNQTDVYFYDYSDNEEYFYGKNATTSTTTTAPLTPIETHDREREILIYMWAQAAVAALCLIATFIYFPNQPPLPPSISAGQQRTDFALGVRQLIRHKSFWLIAASYGVMTGVYSGWGAYLAPNLQHFLSENKAESESGWVGLYATCAGAIGGIGISLFADRFSGHLKIFLMAFCFLAAIVFFWFALICVDVLPMSDLSLYFSNILGGFLLNGTIPLFYEAAVEVTYPIAEGSTAGLLTTMNNIGCLLFLFVPDIPGLGNGWVNWTLVGSCVFSTLILILFKENYHRSSIDIIVEPREKNINPVA